MRGGVVIPSPGPGIQRGWGEALEGDQAPALGSEDRQFKTRTGLPYSLSGPPLAAGSCRTAASRRRPDTSPALGKGGGGIERGGGKKGDSEGGVGGG